MPAKTTRRTLARQWELLKLLPSSGTGKSALELTLAINEAGFSVSKRQVERDLLELSEAFALQCNDRSAPYGWKWPGNASVDIPGLTMAECLSLRLVKDTVQSLLPAALLHALEPRFALAEKKLANLVDDANAAQWPDKVRSVPSNQPMLAPEVLPDVLGNVQDALLANEQVEVEYLAMDATASKPMRLHPLALINRSLVTYLAATAWDYEDVRLYALHRITDAKRVYEPSQRPKNFDLDKYCNSGAMQFGNGQSLVLKARVLDHLERILRETPLSADQTLKDGLVTATVQDTQQLEWWLLSQGDAITVIDPPALRSRVQDRLKEALATYTDATVMD